MVAPLVGAEAAVAVWAVLLVWEEAVREQAAEVYSVVIKADQVAVACLAVAIREPADHLLVAIWDLAAACLAVEYQLVELEAIDLPAAAEVVVEVADA